MRKLLFLAEYAPTNGQIATKPKDGENKFYAESYHFKIVETLAELKCDFYSTSDINFLIDNYKNYDLVWSIYNRINFRNSEIFVQSLCERLGVNYIGATPNIRAIAEDKSAAKALWANHLGIKTAKWVTASKDYPLCEKSPFSAPYFIKPRFGSASIGIDESCFCLTWDEVIKKSEEYFLEDDRAEVIVEEYIDGIYYGVAVVNSIDGKPIIAVPHYQVSNKPHNVITYRQKRRTESGMKRFISNDSTLNELLVSYANKIFLNMQPCDYARIDFIVEKNSGIPYFLEANVLMNMGINSGFVESFCVNIFASYKDLINYILDLGFSKVK